MSGGQGALDPLLGPALQLDQRPIVPGRSWAATSAATLTAVLEEIGRRIPAEGDARSAGQLMNVAEALGVLTISLVAYSRGITPRVGSKKPNTNIIVP